MKIKLPFLNNVRRGLATNSSSSHSLVYHADDRSDMNLGSAWNVDTEFGWDHFILDSLGEKLMYGLTLAIGNTWSDKTEEEMAEAVQEWGHLFPELMGAPELWERAAAGYVDHQSREAVTEEFVDKLRDPHVVVHGGYPYGMDDDDDLTSTDHREMLG